MLLFWRSLQIAFERFLQDIEIVGMSLLYFQVSQYLWKQSHQKYHVRMVSSSIQWFNVAMETSITHQETSLYG